ncbi:hypothetical protein, partial [Tardiphaga sp. P9-11]|uniref:hypothetical protein n=1 Tax=Tardiphaga sp. P9-11 TaxID=2024614 RepID=UPI001FEFD5DF
QRRVRIPIKATAREPINRPDTYQRLPLSKHNLTCDQQPVHTFAPEAVVALCGSVFGYTEAAIGAYAAESLSKTAMSRADSVTRQASAFSSGCFSEEVPGIGMMAGER